MRRLAWSRILGTDYMWYRLRFLLLNVDVRIVMLSCIYLGNIGDTFLIPDLQFETKSGSK